MVNLKIPASQAKLIKRAAWALPVLYFLFFVVGFPVVDVSQGHTGIDLFFGKAIGTRNAGPSIKLPFIKVVEVSNQSVTTTVALSESPTHDLQVAHIDLNSSWSVLPGGTEAMYNYFGGVEEIEQALVLPGLLETQKALSAVAIADEAKNDMNVWLSESLKLHNLPNHIDVATVLFPHVEFSPEFKAATTEQTQAEQSIGTEENKRTKAFTDAEATKAAKVRQAQAEAYQIRKNADAETAGIIAKAKSLRENPGLLCYLVKQGWDGKLPEVSNGASPLPFAEVCKK
jgi:regulator of protease activity HflC (stomatin/prohibitin superfamily)